MYPFPEIQHPLPLSRGYLSSHGARINWAFHDLYAPQISIGAINPALYNRTPHIWTRAVNSYSYLGVLAMANKSMLVFLIKRPQTSHKQAANPDLIIFVCVSRWQRPALQSCLTGWLPRELQLIWITTAG